MLFLAGHSAYMFFFPEIDIRTQQKQNNCDKNHSHSNDETTSCNNHSMRKKRTFARAYFELQNVYRFAPYSR